VRHYRKRLIEAVALLTSVLTVAAVVAAVTATSHHQTRKPGHSASGLAAALRASAAMHVVKPPVVKPSHTSKPTTGPSHHAAAASTTPSESTTTAGSINWGKPIFVDNFSEASLNLNDWGIYNEPNGATGSGTPYTRQSVQLANGYLNITGHYQAPYGYVGGGVESKLNQSYGRWVVRFRAADGAGYEPAVLLWPEGTHADGEIDMAEVYPGSVLPVSTNRLGDGQFLHIGAANKTIGHKNPNSDNFSNWQTVAVDWLPTGIQMYLNGTLTWSVSTDFNGTDYIPDTPFHLAMQLDEGCTRSRCRPDSATPSDVLMQVDWIQIYAAPKS
jgi:hypothetical protein